MHTQMHVCIYTMYVYTHEAITVIKIMIKPSPLKVPSSPLHLFHPTCYAQATTVLPTSTD